MRPVQPAAVRHSGDFIEACVRYQRRCGYNRFVETRSEIARGAGSGPRTLAVVGLDWLHQLLLSLWLGGILILGAVAAPGVFGAAKAAGHTERGMRLWDFAGAAMGMAFQRFALLILVVGLLLTVTGATHGLLGGLCLRRTMARAALTLVAWGISVWMVFGIFPQMEAARSLKNMAVFDVLHHTSSNAFLAQAVLLLGVAALTAWLHAVRAPQTVPARGRNSSREATQPVAGAAH